MKRSFPIGIQNSYDELTAVGDISTIFAILARLEYSHRCARNKLQHYLALTVHGVMLVVMWSNFPIIVPSSWFGW